MRRYLRRRHWDAERARELQAHIDLCVDDLVAGGMSPDDARRQAYREFGNPALVKEQIYDMNSLPIVETLARDVRYACRVLRRSPGFTLTAVLTLAIAVAVNTAVFSVVDGVLLRPLPYWQPEHLALLEATVTAPAGTDARTSQNGHTWVTVRDHATTADAAVFSTWVTGVNLVAGSRATHARQQRVGAGFFGVLGVRPAFGREFSRDEDRAGGPRAVILGHDLWRSTLGGDPSIVGRPITLRGEAHTVVGIMPPGIQGGVRADLWTPLRPSTDGEGGGENYQILLRLKPGVSSEQANAEFQRLAAEINRPSPPPSGVSITYGTVPLQSGLTSDVRRPLTILWAAVAVVLLIASVNLAGLMFARGARRTREIATRMALGSGRAGIVRQLVVESAVLAVTGGVLGVALSVVALDALRSLAENALDLWQPIAVDGRAIAAASIFALAACLICGLAPAFHATRRGVQNGLSSTGARTVAGASSYASRRAVVVIQVALGVMLLVGAALLLRTFTALRGLEPGFDGNGVYAATVSLQDARYETAAHVNRLVTSALERLNSSAGVHGAAVSLGLPYERLLNLGFRHLDGPEADARQGRMTNAVYIAGDYFGTLRIPLRAGRDFTPRDTATSPGVAIVNDTFRREYFGGANPIGRRIRVAGLDREIVGVVGDVQVRPSFGNHGPLDSLPLTYVPLAQTNDGLLKLVHGWFATAFIVRADGAAGAVLPVLRNAIDGVDPLLPFADVRSMGEVQMTAVARLRLLMVLLMTLAGAAVLLTAVGIHGLIAASVTERTREMGIRIALGASAGHAVRTLAAPGVLLAAVGCLVGAVAAQAAVGLLQALIWGVSPTDPATFGSVMVLFMGVAFVASVAPALRILRLDPARTLRAD